VANRIGGAKFTLNGIQYNLTQNEGSNQLHGGLKGFDKVWTMTGCWYEPSLDFELTDDLVKSHSPGFAVEFLGTMCQDYGVDGINFTSVWECDYMLMLTQWIKSVGIRNQPMWGPPWEVNSTLGRNSLSYSVLILLYVFHLYTQFSGRYEMMFIFFNPLNTELNPIRHLLALLGAHHILQVSRLRVNNMHTHFHL